MTTAWSAVHLAAVPSTGAPAAAMIHSTEVVAVVPGIDVWDLGPVRTPSGDVATCHDAELWLALSAPAVGDPGSRHDVARLRLLAVDVGRWRDLGPLFPDGASLGSREWAGTAVYDPRHEVLDVLYTAVGGADQTPHFTQRIAHAHVRATCTDQMLTLGEWGPHRQVLAADGVVYQRTDAAEGRPGFIKAFRDPFPFTDPADGRRWVLFTGSLAESSSPFNGAIGCASTTHDDRLQLESPLIHADGVNNELERPHVVVCGGLYYLFFSTQRRTFADGVDAPTGLYGFVAPTFAGPYEPVNGSGLVLQNPDDEPTQAYSWMVLPDLRVVSFVDMHSLGGVDPEALGAQARAHFGGTVAPVDRIECDGARVRLV